MVPGTETERDLRGDHGRALWRVHLGRPCPARCGRPNQAWVIPLHYCTLVWSEHVLRSTGKPTERGVDFR